MEEIFDRITKTFKYFESKGMIEQANRYLLASVEALTYEALAGQVSREELQRLCERLRDFMVETSSSVSPFVWRVLGVLEEGVDDEHLEEALKLAKETHSMERLDRLEV